MSILISYDGSPSARRAVEVAAHTLGGTPAVLLHVWNPPERITNVADELSSEVIVCGTQGHTAMEADLLGSVSNAQAHHARRPVLIVPSAPRNPE